MYEALMKAKLALKVRETMYQEEKEVEEYTELKKKERKEPIYSPWYPGKFEDNRPAHLRFDWDQIHYCRITVVLLVSEEKELNSFASWTWDLN